MQIIDTYNRNAIIYLYTNRGLTMDKDQKKIYSMTNRFSIQKTLMETLIPMGATIDNFNSKKLLEDDVERKTNYERIKKLIDRYHKQYIEDTLSDVKYLENLKPYAEVYYNSKDKDDLKRLEELLRKEIVSALTKPETYSKMFKKEMITELLPKTLSSEDDLIMVKSFSKFTTYFVDFFQNRKNMYTSEEQSTGIAYRCINDNLPKHLDNVRVFQKALKILPEEVFLELNLNFEGLCGTTIYDVFTVDYFIFLLSQSGIDRYNEIIGGYTTTDGKMIKGINQYINQYNQTADRKNRIPNMKPLYKQILSDRESISFIPATFENDNELISAVCNLYNTDRPEDDFVSIKNIVHSIGELFEEFHQFALDGIFIQNGLAVTELSNGLFKSWSAIRDLWYSNYDLINKPKKVKNIEKFQDKRAGEYKKNKILSLGNVQELINNSEDSKISSASVQIYYKEKVAELITNINTAYANAEPLLESEYDSENKSLKKDENSVALIKNFLDSIKALEIKST